MDMKYIVFILTLFGGCLLADPSKPRLVVLGFDGVSPHLLEKWIQEGYLPHCHKILNTGTYRTLQTTFPAQSPVAWATFATGKNPGKHRIFGFLKRGKSYRPQFSLVHVEKRPLLGGNKGKCLLSVCIATILFFLLYCFRKYLQTWSLSSLIFLILIFTFAVGYSLFTYLPEKIPYPIAFKEGPSFWYLTGKNGVKTVVMNAPIAFPAEKVPGGRLLCSFGIPDAVGTNGIWSRYSTLYTKISSTETGGWKIPLLLDKKIWHGKIMGPPNLLIQEKEKRLQKKLLESLDPVELKNFRNLLVSLKKKRFLQASIKVEKLSAYSLRVEIDQKSQILKEGQWSDWFVVSFDMSPFVHIKTMSRICVMNVNPPELYMTPLQFYPYKLPIQIKISYPSGYARKLADKVGLYPTLGWAPATHALKDELIKEDSFWDDLKYVMNCREKLFFHELDKKDWQLLVGIFYATDRASHMYWRFIDKNHPRYKMDCQKYPHIKNNLRKVYQWMDKIIGKTLKKLRPQDMLLVVSDHGFSSFRWEVNLNRFLYEKGYLVLHSNADLQDRAQVIDLFQRKERLLQKIDWSKTRAYSLGFGKIFINLKGRDPKGIVSPGIEYQNLRSEIREELSYFYQNFKLPKFGLKQDVWNTPFHSLRNSLQYRKKVISKIYFREQIFSGPYVQETADILVGFHHNYRVAWQSTLGSFTTQKTIIANKMKWSGDHCSVAPHLIPGIFLCNRKFRLRPKPSLEDLAPTILSFFNIKIPDDMDGENLLK